MSTEPVSVEEAVLRLSEAEDVVRSYDVTVVHGYAERVRLGLELTGKQRRAVWRTLRHYSVELDGLGIELALIPDPTLGGGRPATRQFTARKDVARCTCENGRLVLRTPFKFKDTCKSIFGARWNSQARAWTYPETSTSANNIRAAFIGQAFESDDRFAELCASYDTEQETQVTKFADVLPPIPVTKTDAWHHQLQAFWFAKDMRAVMLGMDMGTGKSKVTVDLLTNNGAEAVLILCPVSVINVWGREFRLHAGIDWHVLLLRDGSVADRMLQSDRALHECRCGRPHAVVLNYEAGWREPFATWSKEQDWDYVVFDESHRIKSSTGTISKYCHQVSRHSKRRLALTGTPLPQGPLDCFGQYRSLDPDVFGMSYTAFSRRYCLFGGYGGYEVVGFQNLEEFNQRFYSLCFRVAAEDVLDLPPSTDVTRSTELTPKAKKAYKALEGDLYAALDGDLGEVSAPNVLVKLLRLQQLTGGALTNDAGEMVEVDDAKGRLLADVLEDVDAPTVVFCRFIHDLDVVERTCRKLKKPYGELSGRRNDMTDEAHMPEWASVMGVQIQTGGVGVDFTLARYGVYYSLGFSLSDYLQSRRRLVRPGQEHPVLFVHLTISGTIDEQVYDALSAHKEVVDFILTGMEVTK